VVTALEADVAKRKAETDALTELPNRRGFDRALRRVGGGPVALVAIDIDHFKAVNDTYGHAAGDDALRLLGRLLLSALREGDVAARIGGEEFTVLLPGGDLRLAMEVAERLRALVESRPFRAGGGERRLTISCGVSAFPYPTAHPENLVPAADAALYEAKGAGRNCVVAARPASATAVPAGPRAKAVAAPGPPV
jgi:diguanylate cyclase